MFMYKVQTTERQQPGETVSGQPVVHDFPAIKKTTASNVPIVAPNVITSLSLTGNRDWVLCIEYELFI